MQVPPDWWHTELIHQCLHLIKAYATYRCRNIGASNSFDWSIQVIECIAFDNLGADFTPDAKGGETTLDNDKSNSDISKFRKSVR